MAFQVCGTNSKELKRLKMLEEENGNMYANGLDHQMAKEVIEKKTLKPCRKYSITKALVHYGIRACRVLNMGKSIYYQKPLPKDNCAKEKTLRRKVAFTKS